MEEGGSRLPAEEWRIERGARDGVPLVSQFKALPTHSRMFANGTQQGLTFRAVYDQDWSYCTWALFKIDGASELGEFHVYVEDSDESQRENEVSTKQSESTRVRSDSDRPILNQEYRNWQCNKHASRSQSFVEAAQTPSG